MRIRQRLANVEGNTMRAWCQCQKQAKEGTPGDPGDLLASNHRRRAENRTQAPAWTASLPRLRTLSVSTDHPISCSDNIAHRASPLLWIDRTVATIASEYQEPMYIEMLTVIEGVLHLTSTHMKCTKGSKGFPPVRCAISPQATRPFDG